MHTHTHTQVGRRWVASGTRTLEISSPVNDGRTKTREREKKVESILLLETLWRLCAVCNGSGKRITLIKFKLCVEMQRKDLKKKCSRKRNGFVRLTREHTVCAGSSYCFAAWLALACSALAPLPYIANEKASTQFTQFCAQLKWNILHLVSTSLVHSFPNIYYSFGQTILQARCRASCCKYYREIPWLLINAFPIAIPSARLSQHTHSLIKMHRRKFFQRF